jgi:hypothetical protein
MIKYTFNIKRNVYAILPLISLKIQLNILKIKKVVEKKNITKI